MTVLRITVDLASDDVAATRAFWCRLLDLDVLMDLGWVTTLGTGQPGPVQLTIAAEGGGGAPVPALSVEVSDVDAVHARAVEMGATITYPIRDEPWGVRRFFLRDPDGRQINVLSHRSAAADRPG